MPINLNKLVRGNDAHSRPILEKKLGARPRGRECRSDVLNSQNHAYSSHNHLGNMVLQAIKYSPAGATPASLEILDQIALPHHSRYLPITSCEDAWDAIKQMKVRGAPAIAIVAALSLAVELSHERIRTYENRTGQSVQDLVRERLEFLKSSRPTAVNLGDAVAKLNAVVEKAEHRDRAGGSTVATSYIAAAEKMLIDDVRDNEAIGKHGAKWIKENTAAGKRRGRSEGELKVVTHCNTGCENYIDFFGTQADHWPSRSLATAGYGTALGVIRSLHAENILTHVFCSETRPYNQGSRLTAYELVHDQIPATLITDSMAASLLAREGDSVAAVIVGADRVAANGDTANKIGTYSLAVLARHHGVKFLVAAPRTTIDRGTACGKDVVIEKRPGEEVTRMKGPKIDARGQISMDADPEVISVAAAGIDVWNPAFDITPAALIDGIITESGVVEKGVSDRFDFTSTFETATD